MLEDFPNLANTMPFLKKTSEFEQRLDFLLGPYKDVPSSHLQLFKLCDLCKATKNGSGSSCMASNHSNYNVPPNNDAFINSVGQELFVAKTVIPGILSQQNYRQWKSSQDMRFRLHAMRRQKMICIQPLDQFPEFLNDFEWKHLGVKHIGFFTLLKTFLEIFFMGFSVELRESKTLEELGWNVTTRYVQTTESDKMCKLFPACYVLVFSFTQIRACTSCTCKAHAH